MKRNFYTLDQTLDESHWLASATLIYSSGDLGQSVKPNALTREDITPLRYHHRLGKHFEDLFTKCIKKTNTINSVHDHIQVIDKGITLGEADFVLGQNDAWLHLEIAIKFFLKVGKQGRLEDYLGPSLSDSLDRKIQHLTNKQLKLFTHPAAKEQLTQRGIPHIDHCIAQVYGWLYYHIEDTQPTIPSALNPHHSRGLWCVTNELPDYVASLPDSFEFLIPLRGEWLVSPVHQTGRTYDKATLLNYFNKPSNEAEQVMVISGVGRSRQLIARLFVVTEEWQTSANKQIEAQS